MILSVLLFLILALSINAASAVTDNQSTNDTTTQSYEGDSTTEINTTSSLETTTSDNTQYAAGSTPTFTSEQITVAAYKVQKYTDNHNTLPGYVIIDDTKVTMTQFLKLMVQTVINLNNESSESVTLNTSIVDPSSPTCTETVTSGNLTLSQFITLATQINSYINKNGIATSSATTTLGKLNFNNLVYTFSKILNFYNSNDRLPNYISVTTWSEIISSEESSSDISFTSDQINAAAYEVKTYVEEYSTLPDYVTIGDTHVTMTQFLKLMVQNVINLNNGTSTSLTLETSIVDPSSPTCTETVTSGNLTLSQFITLATQINSYINKNGIATSSATTTLGKLNFNNLVYTFSKILNFYNSNDRLPNYVSVTTWSEEESSSTIIKVLIYSGTYASTNCVNGLITALKSANTNNLVSGVTFTYATSTTITSAILSAYDVLIMPGGSGGYYYLNYAGISGSAIKSFVANGGGYIGICAGAYAAAAHTDGYYDGWGIAPHVYCKAVTYEGTTTMTITSAGESVLKRTGTVTLAHYNGAAMYLASTGAVIFGTYADSNTGYKGYADIVGDYYGNGRVVLIGSHPELSPQYPDIIANLIVWATS